MAEPALQIEGLEVDFRTKEGVVHAVRGIDVSLAPGEVLGIVGESGSGKSVTALATMGLLPKGADVRGSVRFQGRELLGLKEKDLSRIRGTGIAMIFQDPMTSLNPYLRISEQLMTALFEFVMDNVPVLLDREGPIDIFFANGARIDDPTPKGTIPQKDGAKYWNRLFHQKVDGAFEDVTEKSGIGKAPGKGMGISIADFNDDGLQDVFIANDTEANSLFINKGDGTFEEQGLPLGVAYDDTAKAVSSMGSDAKDYDSDGRVA